MRRAREGDFRQPLPKPPPPAWFKTACGVTMSIGLAMLLGLGIWYGVVRPVFGG